MLDVITKILYIVILILFVFTLAAVAKMVISDILREHRTHYATSIYINHTGLENWYGCGKCNSQIKLGDHYCRKCGSLIIWSKPNGDSKI